MPRLSLAIEYFNGPMEATTIIIFVRQMIYSIAIPGIFMSTFILNAEVSPQITERIVKYSFHFLKFSSVFYLFMDVSISIP